MTLDEIHAFLARAVDGQPIRVATASGRTFDGIYNAEDSDPADALYFDTMEGQALRAEWDKITTIDYRSARTVAASIMVPPEHPLSGAGSPRFRDDGTPLKPYTTRNR